MEKIGMENIGMEKELKISSFSVDGKKATLYQPLESMVEKNLYQANTNIGLNTNGQTMEVKVLGEKLPEDKLSEGKSSSPLLILHCFSEEEEAVVKLLKGQEYFSFPLLCINNLEWQKDMCPWNSPALINTEKDFIGGADEYLSLLEKEIIPTNCLCLRLPLVSGVPFLCQGEENAEQSGEALSFLGNRGSENQACHPVHHRKKNPGTGRALPILGLLCEF